ncbi:hypothetical protein [Neobacillus sp. SAB-20_R2A]|uniref:hypothetical protein n=1 Tax=Neobacillus sp. SAB-20_R2A TaxID=3120519 RepID=UPI003C6E2807
MKKAEEVSEPRVTSDKIGEKSRGSVRTRGRFGQYRCKKQRKCPNKGALRTVPVKKAEEVSEPRVASDKTGEKSRGTVRTKNLKQQKTPIVQTKASLIQNKRQAFLYK